MESNRVINDLIVLYEQEMKVETNFLINPNVTLKNV
jgi:hypothetical protein